MRAVRKTFRVKGGLLGADRHVVAVDDVSFAVPTGGVLGVNAIATMVAKHGRMPPPQRRIECSASR